MFCSKIHRSFSASGVSVTPRVVNSNDWPLKFLRYSELTWWSTLKPWVRDLHKGGATYRLPPLNKYRARPFLMAGIDSKTCSVDRKSHSAYVRKKSRPKIRLQKKVRSFFRKQKPRNGCHLKNINQIPLKIHWGKSPWSVRKTWK